jgi:hypothetical protein
VFAGDGGHVRGRTRCGGRRERSGGDEHVRVDQAVPDVATASFIELGSFGVTCAVQMSTVVSPSISVSIGAPLAMSFVAEQARVGVLIDRVDRHGRGIDHRAVLAVHEEAEDVIEALPDELVVLVRGEDVLEGDL